MDILKPCNLNECEGCHEGYCIIDLMYDFKEKFICTAKSITDLMTEDEYWGD